MLIKKGEEYKSEEIDFYTGCTLVDVVSMLRLVSVSVVRSGEVTSAEEAEEGLETEEVSKPVQVIPKREIEMIYIDRKGRLKTLAQGPPPMRALRRPVRRREPSPTRPVVGPREPAMPGLERQFSAPGSSGRTRATGRSGLRSGGSRGTTREPPGVIPFY